MKIALVYAGHPEDLNAQLSFPLGLGYIGAVLQEAGFTVSALDMRFVESDYEISAFFRREKPYIVGISALTPQMDQAVRAACLSKSVFKNVPVVLGGPHATALPYKTLESPEIDFGFIGESEYTFLDFVKSREAGRDPTDIEGLIYHQDGHIVANPKHNFIRNLDELPFPARELFPADRLMIQPPPGPFLSLYPYANLMAGRGCPFQCNYCQPTKELLFGKKCRLRSPENVLDEVEMLIGKYGLKVISFDDDTFTYNKKWVLRFCDEIERRGLYFNFSIQSRVDTVNPEMLERLRDVGCYLIYWGVESGSQKTLDFLHKGATVVDNENAIRWSRQLGILSEVNMMVGNIGESKDDLAQTVEFVRRMRPDLCWVNRTTPFPGTYLYEEAREAGLIGVKDFIAFERGYFGEKLKLVDLDIGDLLAAGRAIFKDFFDLVLFVKYGYYRQAIFRRLKLHIKNSNWSFLFKELLIRYFAGGAIVIIRKFKRIFRRIAPLLFSDQYIFKPAPLRFLWKN